MSVNQQPTAAARLRELLSDSSHTVVAPGVYDGISARLALAQGFECLYMVGQDLTPCGETVSMIWQQTYK
jgi:2-methylisocitrate lyase-like PEP mutase family enzyme